MKLQRILAAGAMFGFVLVNLPAPAAAGEETTARAGADGFVMLDGRIAISRGDRVARVEEEMEVTTGIRITPGGTVKFGDDTTTQLMDRQMITMGGKIIDAPESLVAKVAELPDGRSQTREEKEETMIIVLPQATPAISPLGAPSPAATAEPGVRLQVDPSGTPILPGVELRPGSEIITEEGVGVDKPAGVDVLPAR